MEMARVSVYDQPRNQRSLWIGWLSGPVVYSVYFMLGYLLGEFGCDAGLQRFSWRGVGLITAGTGVLTVLAAATTLTIGIRTFRRWRVLRRKHAQGQDSPAGFLSFTGAWLNGLFTVLILLTGLPAWLLEICEWV
jgi:hypothetical protein